MGEGAPKPNKVERLINPVSEIATTFEALRARNSKIESPKAANDNVEVANDNDVAEVGNLTPEQAEDLSQTVQGLLGNR